MKKINPFDECPIYETNHFTFKLVNEKDAGDLFICYSDPITLSHMNNDNCNGKWHPQSQEELRYAWQKDYKNRTFIRWTIRNKKNDNATGTIEIAPLPWGRWFFGKEKPIGILRIDILSNYEKEDYFFEIMELMSSELANDFEVDQVIIKAPPSEPEKVSAVISNGFIPYSVPNFPYEHYYVKSINSVSV